MISVVKCRQTDDGQITQTTPYSNAAQTTDRHANMMLEHVRVQWLWCCFSRSNKLAAHDRTTAQFACQRITAVHCHVHMLHIMRTVSWMLVSACLFACRCKRLCNYSRTPPNTHTHILCVKRKCVFPNMHMFKREMLRYCWFLHNILHITFTAMQMCACALYEFYGGRVGVRVGFLEIYYTHIPRTTISSQSRDGI